MNMNPSPGETLAALEDHDAFHRAPYRHGRAETRRRCWPRSGFATRARADRRVVPRSIRRATPHGARRGPMARGRGARASARHRRDEPGPEVVIGQGYYGTHTPGVILRNVLENPAWYTAYTPYQPEISQGRLEALLNFQTMVCDLTGHGDRQRVDARRGDRRRRGDDAAALRVASSRVAAFLRRRRRASADARRRAHARRSRWASRCAWPGGERARAPRRFGVLLQYPGANGDVRDYARARPQAAHAKGALVVVAADLLALTLITPPGEWGADVAVGIDAALRRADGIRRPACGVHGHARRVQALACPGGWSACHGRRRRARPAYRLALQTREQHIRREKATSNICTAQVLLAVMAAMYAVYHGPRGPRAHRAPRAPPDGDPARPGLARLGFDGRQARRLLRHAHRRRRRERTAAIVERALAARA